MTDCSADLGIQVPPSYAALKMELTLWARIRQTPLHATYEITPYCNLKCPMCYVRLDPAAAACQGKLMSGGQWLEIARQSRDLGTLFVTLTGGEPFLHPDFWEIYNGMVEMGFLVSIYTNGCLIDESVVERLKANPPLNIKMSIYGASNETYETMCGVKNGFDRAIRAIDLLKESGLPFYCTSTAVHENMHDMGALYRLAYERGVKFFHTNGVTTSARGALSDPQSSRARPEELHWTLEALEKDMRDRNTNPFAFCAHHRISYFMTWHGHMQFCGFTNKPYVQITETVDMPAAWATMLEQMDAITVPPECAECEDYAFCKRCPGLLASESGDPCKTCESFCSQARETRRIYERLKAEAEKAAAPSTEN